MMTNNENILKSISDLKIAIEKYANSSTCLDTFENLLKEVHDIEYVKTIIIDMHKIINELACIYKTVDKIDNPSIKSKILTYEFIQPDRFFKQSVKATNRYICLNAAINAKFYHNRPDMIKIWDIGESNKLGNVWDTQYFRIGDPHIDSIIDSILKEFNIINNNDIAGKQEECRKVILVWNYCPAIYKAMIQTKRRSLGLDNNSKKFK